MTPSATAADVASEVSHPSIPLRDAGAPTNGSPRRRRRGIVLGALAGATVVGFIVALGLGPVAIAPGDTVAILIRSAFGADASAIDNNLVVTELRLPRALLALLAGAGLAVAGAAMQAYFRNPLAEPGVTGVASGSAVGAVSVIVLGLGGLGAWTLPAAAFLGAMGALAVISVVSLVSRDRSPVTVLLLGIALNAFCGAVTGAIVANAEDSQTVRGALFWLQGDLTSASWSDLALIVLPALLGIAVVFAMTPELNALLLGDETAASTGVHVARVRVVLLVLTSVIVGSIVAVTGVIGFVGLVAPHIVRLLLGSDHRFLLPGSALLGGLFLVAADTVARLAPGGGSWQTGIVTALVGAPVFVVLVLRTRNASRRAA
ncbi:MAG: FecCD family ABC transporter permease [Pseudoclavibacter sp.]